MGEASAMTAVRGVTYDLWLTLLVDDDPASTHTLRARTLADVLGVSYEAAVHCEHQAHRAMYEGWLERRALSVPDLAAVVLQAAGRELDDLDAVAHALQSPTSKAGVRLLPGARETLTAVAEAGLPLGLICDTGMSSGVHLRELLDDLGLLELFTVTVFSDETGVPKPAALPFETALAGLGTEPGETVHVGDIRRRDVAGALAAGMRAVRYRGGRDDEDRESPDAPDVIDEHGDVLPLLGLSPG